MKEDAVHLLKELAHALTLEPSLSPRTHLAARELWAALDTVKTYQLGRDRGTEAQWILCLRCKRRSYNQGDIEHKYCGHCHVFHEGP